MKVYVLVSGDYSDYSIHGVVTDKALADQAEATGWCDAADEYEVLTEIPKPVTIYSYSCATKEGTGWHGQEIPAWEERRWETLTYEGSWQLDNKEPPLVTLTEKQLTVRGTDRERVRKIFSDKRAMAMSFAKGVF